MISFVIFFTIVSLIGFIALLASMLASTEKNAAQAGWLVYKAAIVIWGAHLLGLMSMALYLSGNASLGCSPAGLMP